VVLSLIDLTEIVSRDVRTPLSTAIYQRVDRGSETSNESFPQTFDEYRAPA